MKGTSASTLLRRAIKLEQSYKKACCELHLMRLSGMVSKREFLAAQAELDEAFEIVLKRYNVRSKLLAAYVPAFLSDFADS